jgi:hypothetical protein
MVMSWKALGYDVLLPAIAYKAGLAKPTGAEQALSALTSAITAAHNGAAALVPPIPPCHPEVPVSVPL